MAAGKRKLPVDAPCPSEGGERPLEPELLEIIRALAREAARRDHAAEMAGLKGNG